MKFNFWGVRNQLPGICFIQLYALRAISSVEKNAFDLQNAELINFKMDLTN
jgi:hypothetical protein